MYSMYVIRMSICSILLMILMLIRQIHIIQLNSYNLDQQIIWYKKNFVFFVMNIVLIVSTVLVYKLKFIPAYILLVVSLLGILLENLPKKQKKKLVYTARIKRLIFICAILLLLFYIPLIIYKEDKYLEIVLYGVGFTPLVIFIGYLIMLPIENAFRKKFMNEAHEIIKGNDRIYTIGITGSFGKTSVKYYLSQILKTKYNVCMTPESFNTAMGATLTIKNDLKSYDDIFICEMGARRVGDIKEICDIVEPYGAILTDVGDMHLDTFKNIENVRKCKFELIDSVYGNNNKCGGVCDRKIVLINGDNDLILEKIKKYNFDDSVVFTYGLKNNNDFYAENIKASSEGISFDVVCFSNTDMKNTMTFETKLLGLYNIKNLVAAIVYAMLLNVPNEDIINSVKRIEAVSHRLQLFAKDPENLIIDDAYNSNPKGARNAVDVFSTFEGYKKVIITPGMVELGDKQDFENENFAKYASEKVDYAIIVGKTNKEALYKGFSYNLKGDNLLSVDRVDIAINYARNNILGKKVILLENDLSDNY